ncbi:hypothetical protein PUW25_01135 [Paenibacillus urinalis]|uniref:Uncharacterized protein n=1 Tax=Paenibacillus urinalis TaxID=521520 RepID=A0ABY7XA23_9BACL|nr:hypothetical protein [Paenibacillus urinalis]WDI02648.1 hypothetical protein PUW25_01135 [Paenibacillus urinalis]
MNKNGYKGVSHIRIAEKWAMYPMHLLIMFMINLFFGTMNLFWAVYEDHSILSTTISLLYLTTWMLYALFMRRCSGDFMILTSIFWLGGLALLALLYTVEQVSIALLLLFFSSIHGFTLKLEMTDLWLVFEYGLISLTCYIVVIAVNWISARRYKQKKPEVPFN